MAQLLTDMGAVFTFMVGKFSEILALFTTEPLLLLLLGIMIVGAVIGLTMRVIHRS